MNRRVLLRWGLWGAALVGTTALLLALRGTLDKAHFALAFLLVVLGGSASGGRRLGFALAVLAFFSFNFFLLPPFHTLWVADGWDWLVLAAFLVTSGVATHLLARAESEARRAGTLREIDRFKNTLLASVSHDLRTPLTTIKALADQIAADGEERAEVIRSETDRLNRFVGNLLELSRIQSGVLPVESVLVPAEDLVGAAIRSVAASFGTRELRTRLDGDPALLVGRLDFTHALRILVNLLENAHRYAPPDAPIELEVSRTAERIRFAVRDRGPGVPIGERERIWEPFYRPRDAAQAAAGIGLGLAIARRLAEAQGGSLDFEPREGGGSSFVFEAPAPVTEELRAISL